MLRILPVQTTMRTVIDVSEAKRISRKAGFGLGKGIPADHRSIEQAIAEVMSAPWVDVIVMSTALGIGRCAGYEEAKKGSFGAFKVAGQYRIPTAPLREALHLPSTLSPVDHAACHNNSSSASHSNAA